MNEFETIHAEYSDIRARLSRAQTEVHELFIKFRGARAKFQEACSHEHIKSEAVFNTYEGYDGTAGDVSCRVCGRRGRSWRDQPIEWWPVNTTFSLDDYLHGRIH